MKIVISGVTGLVGTALYKNLQADGVEVLGLTRQQSLPNAMQVVHWDIERGSYDASPLDGADAVVHLTGENIAKRWSDQQKKLIRSSRIDSTSLLINGLKHLKNKPRVLISASAIGFYGDRGNEVLLESSSPGNGFLSKVCQEWEQTANQASELGIRTVNLRLGIVLSTKGGALKQMLLPFRMGVGGPVGTGQQYMSWIHIDDLVHVFRFVLDKDSIRGRINVTAPNPVTNAEFAKALGKVLKRPAFLPAPGFAVKLLLGEMAQALLLDSQRVLPNHLLKASFVFQHPEIGGALQDILHYKK